MYGEHSQSCTDTPPPPPPHATRPSSSLSLPTTLSISSVSPPPPLHPIADLRLCWGVVKHSFIPCLFSSLTHPISYVSLPLSLSLSLSLSFLQIVPTLRLSEAKRRLCRYKVWYNIRHSLTSTDNSN